MNTSERKAVLWCRLAQTEWWFLKGCVIKVCTEPISKACVESSGEQWEWWGLYLPWAYPCKGCQVGLYQGCWAVSLPPNQASECRHWVGWVNLCLGKHTGIFSHWKWGHLCYWEPTSQYSFWEPSALLSWTMRAESECIKEEFQPEIFVLVEEDRFWQICTCEPCLWLSKEYHATDLCSCPVKGCVKRTESDILNYKNTVSALSSQEFGNVLPHLLFVQIY